MSQGKIYVKGTHYGLPIEATVDSTGMTIPRDLFVESLISMTLSNGYRPIIGGTYEADKGLELMWGIFTTKILDPGGTVKIIEGEMDIPSEPGVIY